MDEKEKFYEKKWFIILMLFLFSPVGMALMWMSDHWTKKTRKKLFIIFGIYFIILLFNTPSTEEKEAEKKAKQEQQEIEEKKDLKEDKKQAEKDKKQAEKDKRQAEKEKKRAEKEKNKLEEKLEKEGEKLKEKTKKEEGKQEKKKKEKRKKPDSSRKNETSDVEKELEKSMEKVSLSKLIDFNGYFNEEPYTIQVVLLGKESLTTNMTVDGMKRAILDVVYIIKDTNYEIDNIRVSMKYPMVDQYGNEAEQFVIKSVFNGETINKLADDQFAIDLNNLGTIADTW